MCKNGLLKIEKDGIRPTSQKKMFYTLTKMIFEMNFRVKVCWYI